MKPVTAIGLTLMDCAPFQFPADAAERPNVLVTDDQGYGDLSTSSTTRRTSGRRIWTGLRRGFRSLGEVEIERLAQAIVEVTKERMFFINFLL